MPQQYRVPSVRWVSAPPIMHAGPRQLNAVELFGVVVDEIVIVAWVTFAFVAIILSLSMSKSSEDCHLFVCFTISLRLDFPTLCDKLTAPETHDRIVAVSTT